MAETQEMTRLLSRLVWFSITALVLMGATVAEFFVLERRAQRSYIEKREVSRIGRSAAALATDRETGIRGYQLTRDQRSLVPDVVARAELPAKLDSLGRLSASDSAHASRVQSIARTLRRWETEFADPAIRGDIGPDSMLAGKPQFDEVRAAFNQFLVASEVDLRHEAAHVRRLQLLRLTIVLSELLAFVGLLLFVIRGRLMRQAGDLGHQQELLEQQAVELELQMAEMQATNDALAEREEKLQNSEERYRYAARLSNDAIYDWDVASNRFEWNDGLKELFGYTDAEIGTTIEWIVGLLHPEDTDRVMESFYTVFEKGGGSQWKTEYRLQRRNGKYANAEGRAYMVRDANGTTKRVIGAITDRTQQQSLEVQLRQSQKMEAIGRLAGGIAHDFNNILTVIRMSSEFLLNDLPESDEKHHDAKEIMKAADRAAGLTRQLLAFSRHQVLNPSILNLNDVVSGMDGMVRRVVPENIQLVTELAPDLRSVKADAGQMEQVLLNLVINASDAMPNGGILSVRTTNTSIDAMFSAKHLDLPPGQYVGLTVSDTGIGMDPDTVARIFEPFFTTKSIGKGTGLGLSTVHGIVTQSGGRIWVYSELSVGTTFKVFLPRAEGVATPTGVQIVEEPFGPPSETILLVEDEEPTRVAILRNLTRVGYKVIAAANGVEALRIAGLYPSSIDVLLTDSMMPEMGGVELVRQLRKERPGISVLMMSGYMEDLAPTGSAGEKELFIEKPFNTADLLTAIRSAVKAEK
jgi:PAS domain S-box-containing protein